MLEDTILNVTLLVTDTLDKLEVDYVIGGSVASMVHGVVRSTLDVDMIADLTIEQVGLFVESLQDQFYVDETSIRQAIQRKTSFNLIHLATMVKVDVFLPKQRLFDRQQLARRVAERVTPETQEQEKLWILSAEDVILAKLDWFRMGGEVSERQWRDVIGVIKTQGEHLDHDYLQHWARELNVQDLLEQALKER